MIALFSWAVSVARNRRSIRGSWFYFCLAGYAFAVTLSTIASADPSQSAVKLAGKFYLIGIAVLAFNIITSATVFKKVLQAWLIGTALSLLFCLIGIFLFYVGLKDPEQNLVIHPIFGSLPAGNYPRIEGFFSYPAMFCNYLSASWMFAILMLSVGWLRTAKFWLFGVSLWIVAFFTLTPGIGGILLSTGWFLKRRLERSKKRVVSRAILFASLTAAAVLLFIASVTFVAYSPTGSTIPLANGEISRSHRAEAWRTALVTFWRNPIVGRGVGLPIADSSYTDPSGNNQLLTDAHNTYISILGETGLAGFITFFSIVGFIVYGLRKRDSETEFYGIVKLCLLLAFADAFFYQSLTGSYEDARHLWALFGISAAVTHGFFPSPTLTSFTSAANRLKSG
ncbi:MAG: O-antigen ligase family protein [Blastocatellia bacterium]|nr:O-antigen ligase family protein [Blastocatellia bacterium]